MGIGRTQEQRGGRSIGLIQLSLCGLLPPSYIALPSLVLRRSWTLLDG
jgi:hypothetical protein